MTHKDIQNRKTSPGGLEGTELLVRKPERLVQMKAIVSGGRGEKVIMAGTR